VAEDVSDGFSMRSKASRDSAEFSGIKVTGPAFRALSFSEFADVSQRDGAALSADSRITFCINGG
jgi:hypothetical protein